MVDAKKSPQAKILTASGKKRLAKRIKKPIADFLAERILDEAIRHCDGDPVEERVIENAERIIREIANLLPDSLEVAKHVDISWIDKISPEEPGFCLEMAIEKIERDLISAALEKAHGETTRAANLLGISQQALRYKLTTYQMDCSSCYSLLEPKDEKIDATYSIKATVKKVEEECIRKALEKCSGDIDEAAGLLKISKRALLYKMREYEINLER